MMRPRLLDVYCGGGGAGRGYQLAGFEVTGVDIVAQPRYAGDHFIQADALEYLSEHGHEYDAVHASPPCQFASIMNNLPWLRGKEYPALIEPTRQLLRQLGKPWVIENVMGARWGSKQLAQRGYADHGLQAGFLCGTMFGRRFYRHRLFAANWLWLAPPHPRHRVTITPSRRDNRTFIGTDEGAPRAGVIKPGPLLGSRASTVIFPAAEGAVRADKAIPGYGRTGRSFVRLLPEDAPRGRPGGQAAWAATNAANGITSGVGHTAGIAEARREMGCEWMTRAELSQAIPPCYTEHIGRQLRRYLGG